MAKTCPSCGYQETDPQSLYCNKCGFPFPQNPPGRPAGAAAPGHRPAPAARRSPRRRSSGAAGFLSFEILITTGNLKMIYIIGAVLIILVSVMGITGGFAVKGAVPANMSFTNTSAAVQHPASSPLFWIGFLVFGNILWRMFCEIFVLLSRPNGFGGSESEAVDEEEEYGEEYAAAPVDVGPTQYVECPKCHKIVPLGDLRECEHCGVQGCVNCIRSVGLLKKTMTCRECFEAK